MTDKVHVVVDCYERCVRLTWEEVEAALALVGGMTGAEVRATYAALGQRSRQTVSGMRDVIRRGVRQRKGAYERCEV